MIKATKNFFGNSRTLKYGKQQYSDAMTGFGNMLTGKGMAPVGLGVIGGGAYGGYDQQTGFSTSGMLNGMLGGAAAGGAFPFMKAGYKTARKGLKRTGIRISKMNSGGTIPHAQSKK